MATTLNLQALEAARKKYLDNVAALDAAIQEGVSRIEQMRRNRFANLGAVQAVDDLIAAERKAFESAPESKET